MERTGWKEFRLGDIATILSGGDAPRGHISKFKTRDYCIPIYSNGISAKGLYGYTDKATVFEPATTISARGTIGVVYKRTEPYLPIVRLISVIGDRNIVDSDFLYYNLCGTKISGDGSVQAQLTVPMISEYIVRLPDVVTQKKIAQILSCLDSKIELNTQINQNLEAQAQAIFRSWFVDFEPFGGVVPQEIEKINLESLCILITKGTTPTTVGLTFSHRGINFIKAESINDTHGFDISKFSHIDLKAQEALKRSIVKSGDILFSIAGTLGRLAMADESILPANINQAIAIIRADPYVCSPNYIYSFFLAGWHKEHYGERIQQAVQANLSLTTIRSLPILLLPDQPRRQYEKLINPLFAKITQNTLQSLAFSKLRDTLLPKLMSGEIDVSEVEV